MIKTTYVPNMIGIPTHGVDLWHHILRIGERTPKSSIKPPQGEERKRKKEKEEEGPVPYFTKKLRQLVWRDCFMSHVRS
jgi:hypothetical protein